MSVLSDHRPPYRQHLGALGAVAPLGALRHHLQDPLRSLAYPPQPHRRLHPQRHLLQLLVVPLVETLLADAPQDRLVEALLAIRLVEVAAVMLAVWVTLDLTVGLAVAAAAVLGLLGQMRMARIPARTGHLFEATQHDHRVSCLLNVPLVEQPSP